MEHNRTQSNMLNNNILLREYQKNIIEKAKKSNSIVYLPTGAGKTLIAIHVLCSKTSEIIRPYNEDGKRAFIVASTKVMAFQLAKILCAQTKFNVGYFIGDMNLDSWDKEEWTRLFMKHHVLVMTAEILRRIVAFKFITHDKISLFVFDECQHGTLLHPYKRIMDVFEDVPDEEMPLILGLSASLLNVSPKEKDITKLLKQLEATYRARIVTVDQTASILSVCANPEEITITYKAVDLGGLAEVLNIYENAISVFDNMQALQSSGSGDTEESRNKRRGKQVKKCLVSAKEHLMENGVFVGSLATLYAIIAVEKFRLLLDDNYFNLPLMYARTELYKIRLKLLNMMGNVEDSTSIYELSAPKVRKLIDILVKCFENRDNSRVIVFVRQRQTAILLAYMIKRLKVCDKRFDNMKPEYVISTNSTGVQYSLEEESARNEEIVQRFAAGEVNIMFATNILEEGIDVAACNVVVNFDFPLSYSSYIQSRGRARNKLSQNYIMYPDGDSGKSTTLAFFKHVEQTIRESVTAEGSDVEAQEDTTDTEKHFISIGEGIVIDGSLAIQWVTAYCQSLPQDKYSQLTPEVWYVNTSTGKRAYLQLPINSAYVDVIEGDFRSNYKAAKKSVYLKTAEILYKLNVIDETLNVVKVGVETEMFRHLFPHFKQEKVDKHSPRPGTNKRKQVYDIYFAECLHNSLPRPGTKAYLHLIVLNAAYSKPEAYQKATLYDLLQSPGTYGILTSKKLPKLCSFPVYMTMGRIDVNLVVNFEEIVLTESEWSDIKLFHFALFNSLLKTVKPCQMFDNRNNENSYFVVPLTKKDNSFALHWIVIRSDFCKRGASTMVRFNPSVRRGQDVCDSTMPTPSNSCQFTSLVPKNVIDGRLLWGQSEGNTDALTDFILTEATYTNFVISPNYRYIDHTQLYVVSSVLYNMSPLSPFPREEFPDFYSYYKAKYSVHVTNLKQPLLKVSILPRCSNFSKPVNRLEESARKRKMQDELLIPELCNVYPFLKSFWMKALLLPSILNRMSQLCRLEELRKRIVRETGLGTVEVGESTGLKPVRFDVPVEDSGNEANVTRLKNSLDVIEKLSAMLPVTYLKKKITKSEGEFLVPERNLYEMGLCDLENYMKLNLYVDEIKENLLELQRLMCVEEIEKVVDPNVRVPKIELLNAVGSDIGVELRVLLEAFTSKFANDGTDYERLEILGDSFLKFAVSLFLFRAYPKVNEGALTHIKGQLVGNRNLLYCGGAKQLAKYINDLEFSPTVDWQTPLFCVPEEIVSQLLSGKIDPTILNELTIPDEEQFSGTLSRDTLENVREIIADRGVSTDVVSSFLMGRQLMSDKVISDVVEALIGAYIQEYGLPGGFLILSWLNVLPDDTGSFDNLLKKPYMTEPAGTEENVMILLENVIYQDLEETLGYTFKNKGLLLEALTHPSYSQNRVTYSYQRLEFLGDSVLDFLITSYVYEKCRKSNPGQITDIRSALVNNVTFACLTVRYGFHKYLLSSSTALSKCIQTFVSLQASKNHVVNESVVILTTEDECNIADSVAPPKALGDVFESLAGAIFLDSGNSLETVWNVYYRLMRQEIEEFIKTVPKSSVRLLHEICGDNKPFFEIGESAGDNSGWLNSISISVVTTQIQPKEQNNAGYGNENISGEGLTQSLRIRVDHVPGRRFGSSRMAHLTRNTIPLLCVDPIQSNLVQHCVRYLLEVQ